MFPLQFTRIGSLAHKIENADSFYAFDTEMKKIAKKVETRQIENGYNHTDYVTQKDFWGFKEIITIVNNGDTIVSISITSRLSDEFDKTLHYVKQNYTIFYLFMENDNMEIYKANSSDILLYFCKNIKQKGVYYMILLREKDLNSL